MIPTPEQAWELLCEFNEGDFHRRHGRTVGDVMRWFAQELGFGEEAGVWEAVGILHDLDFEQWPEEHCVKSQEPWLAVARTTASSTPRWRISSWLLTQCSSGDRKSVV